MAQSAQALVQEMSALKNRNLAFLNEYFPDIYKAFKDKELTHSRLNIDPNNLEVDLLIDDKPLYNNDTRAVNRQEAETFSNAFKPDSYNHPLRHTYADEVHQGRFAHGSLGRFLTAAGAVKGTAAPYLFEQSLPQVVFLGCGLGLHIKELLELRDVRHGILVEHDSDRFLASLYVTDWADILQPYIDDKTRSFSLSVGDTRHLDYDKRVHTAFAAAWNNSCINVPFMPIQTVFYVHQADDFYTDVATRLNNEIEPFINVWGYYDDEMNQLNHVMHNFKRGIPVLKKQDFSEHPKITLICGNGPSLDSCIELIKEFRDHITLISAGSTTHTLLTQDIYPDAVVTLESDLATYGALTLLPTEKAKKVPVIGAAQIHPYTFKLFGDGLLYLKQETAYAQAFGKENERIANGTPSATNAALALAMDLKLPNLHLVGLDFGFLFAEQSHAQGAFYYDEEQSQRFQNFRTGISQQAYYLETNEHGKIYTTPFYNTSRVHAERKILESKGDTTIINLSQGATITGTDFGSADAFHELLKTQQTQPSEAESFFKLLKKSARKPNDQTVKQGRYEIYRWINSVCIDARKYLAELEPNRDSIDTVVHQINRLVTGRKKTKNNGFQTFIRGSFWHWLYNYYALTKQINNQDRLEEITDIWKDHFDAFLKYLPEHFNSYFSDLSDQDEKLNLTISDPEPGIEEWFKKMGI